MKECNCNNWEFKKLWCVNCSKCEYTETYIEYTKKINKLINDEINLLGGIYEKMVKNWFRCYRNYDFM